MVRGPGLVNGAQVVVSSSALRVVGSNALREVSSSALVVEQPPLPLYPGRGHTPAPSCHPAPFTEVPALCNPGHRCFFHSCYSSSKLSLLFLQTSLPPERLFSKCLYLVYISSGTNSVCHHAPQAMSRRQSNPIFSQRYHRHGHKI